MVLLVAVEIAYIRVGWGESEQHDFNAQFMM